MLSQEELRQLKSEKTGMINYHRISRRLALGQPELKVKPMRIEQHTPVIGQGIATHLPISSVRLPLKSSRM